MNQPNVVHVINVKAVSKLQGCEKFRPGCPNLGRYIHPKAFDMHIMYTSEFIVSWSVLISGYHDYLPQI